MYRPHPRGRPGLGKRAFDFPAREHRLPVRIPLPDNGTRVVDGVSDVLNIPKDDIQAAPDFGAEVDARFINGMAKAGEKLVVLLDIDKVLIGDEMLEVAAQV